MHLNFVYWFSQHPIKDILPTFLGQTPHFINEKQKPKTSNLHQAGSVAVILSLRVGVRHMGGLALMVISPKNWEFSLFCMSLLGIIQPHLKSFSDLSEPIGRSESEYAKT